MIMEKDKSSPTQDKLITNILGGVISGVIVLLIGLMINPNESTKVQDTFEPELKETKESHDVIKENDTEDTNDESVEVTQPDANPFTNTWYVTLYYVSGSLAGNYYHSVWDIKIVDEKIHIHVLENNYQGSQNRPLTIIDQSLSQESIQFTSNRGSVTYRYELFLKNEELLMGSFTEEDEFAEQANDYLKQWTGLDNEMGNMGKAEGKIWLSRDQSFHPGLPSK